jgi:hypothetical protein
MNEAGEDAKLQPSPSSAALPLPVSLRADQLKSHVYCRPGVYLYLYCICVHSPGLLGFVINADAWPAELDRRLRHIKAEEQEKTNAE